MDPSLVIDVVKEALWVLLKVSLPLLLIALIVGLIVSLFQALTQIQEPTLTFVPKIIALALGLAFLSTYIGATLGDFSDHLFSMMVNLE